MSNELITVGKVGKAYGIKGWVKLQSFTDPIENIKIYQPWLINFKGTWQAIEVEAVKLHQQGLIVKFAAINSPEAAKVYVNCEIAVPRAQLPTLAKNEFYWHDLQGLTVVNLQGVTLGTVDEVLATGANDVLVVKGKKEYLIPFLVKQFVIEIDLVKKQITVDWDPEF